MCIYSHRLAGVRVLVLALNWLLISRKMHLKTIIILKSRLRWLKCINNNNNNHHTIQLINNKDTSINKKGCTMTSNGDMVCNQRRTKFSYLFLAPLKPNRVKIHTKRSLMHLVLLSCYPVVCSSWINIMH